MYLTKSINIYQNYLSKVMNQQSETLSFPPPLEVINRNNCVYTLCYCEENVWKLVENIQRHSKDALNNCYVVFVSNNNKLVPLWKQKASTKDDGFVIWDYHVFLIYEGQKDCMVYDLDSQLPFPCNFSQYCNETFKSDNDIKPEFHRFFRVIRGDYYLKYFASDRRHMKNEDGSWVKPPPIYSPISTKDSVHNLAEYISMSSEKESQYGIVFSLTNFCDRFLKPCSRSRPNVYQFDENVVEPNWL